MGFIDLTSRLRRNSSDELTGKKLQKSIRVEGDIEEIRTSSSLIQGAGVNNYLSTSSSSTDDQSHSTQDIVKETGRDGPTYSDVWYRRFLRPLSRQNRPIPYRESFRRRILRPVGIPIPQLNGLHEIFEPPYRHYSPLFGMIFTYNNYIENVYRYGDPSEPVTDLIRRLFHALPGGEIQPTHLGGEAGSHLSPSIVAIIFETFEAMKMNLKGDSSDSYKALAVQFNDVIGKHPDYQESRATLLDDVVKAKADLDALQVRDQESVPIRDKIKLLEGVIIKKARHKIKRAEQLLRGAKEEKNIQELQTNIEELKARIEETEKEVDDLRDHIVTSADFKAARKAVSRAQAMVDRESESLESLSQTLARSFCSYEATAGTPDHDPMSQFTTTSVLLGWIWAKYDSVHYLKGYFETMHRMGALNCDMNNLIVRMAESSKLTNISKSSSCQGNLKKWTATDVAIASMVTLLKPGVGLRPPVIPFSYISWADYSEFPDCAETALRNLINQIIFNPETGRFDHYLLQELKEDRFQGMEQNLIDFYEKHSVPQDALNHEAAKDWIKVVSNLNKDPNQLVQIRYRREKQQQNIASPLKNALRVFNALFGINLLHTTALNDVAVEINRLRGWSIQVDLSKVQDDGFGIVGLSDGKVRYELQSYKPVHFGFVQVETMELGSQGHRDYRTFLNLKHYNKVLSQPNKSKNRRGSQELLDEIAKYEQFAIASIYVPYDVDRRKATRMFHENPHIGLLFADLTGSSQNTALDVWGSEFSNNSHLTNLITRIRSYKEPTFMPSKKSDIS